MTLKRKESKEKQEKSQRDKKIKEEKVIIIFFVNKIIIY